jgi:tRNA G18 (ribose-2'-O)-methylase SpoU
VAVPQREGVESLNAGVAGSLLLYELARAHGLFGPPRAGTTAP